RHNVLNAINHEAEANIIAQAGRHEQVTIATNKAGRGTDLLLGRQPECLARADMENEWIQRAGPKQGGSGTVRRYEETLRDLRESFDEEVERAHTTFRTELSAIEERRTEALRELTEANPQLLDLSPYRDERT